MDNKKDLDKNFESKKDKLKDEADSLAEELKFKSSYLKKYIETRKVPEQVAEIVTWFNKETKGKKIVKLEQGQVMYPLILSSQLAYEITLWRNEKFLDIIFGPSILIQIVGVIERSKHPSRFKVVWMTINKRASRAFNMQYYGTEKLLKELIKFLCEYVNGDEIKI